MSVVTRSSRCSPRISVTMAALAIAALVGCTQLQVGHKSPLTPPVMTATSVAVDIFFVRVPVGDQVAEKLWENVDEQVIPPELRQSLYRNGFRAGRIAGAIPKEIAELLHLTDETLEANGLETIEEPNVSEESLPVRRHLQVKFGQRSELLASSVYDELPLLRRDEQGQVVGQTVPQAQGVFGMTISPKPDGLMSIQLVPEVHYGEPRVQPVSSDGLVRWEMRRERIVLRDLAIAVDLAPGDMLIVTCTPNQPGSLGGRFFTLTSSGKREQKIIAIRLSQVQTNPTFQDDAMTTAGLRSSQPFSVLRH